MIISSSDGLDEQRWCKRLKNCTLGEALVKKTICKWINQIISSDGITSLIWCNTLNYLFNKLLRTLAVIKQNLQTGVFFFTSTNWKCDANHKLQCNQTDSSNLNWSKSQAKLKSDLGSFVCPSGKTIIGWNNGNRNMFTIWKMWCSDELWSMKPSNQIW